MSEAETLQPIIRTAPGAFLALSPPGARFGIGVVGASPAEAEANWRVSYARWESYEETAP